MRQDFLWAGATSANQLEGGYLEGGKGLSNADVITGGNVSTPRRVTYQIEKDTYYPSHEAVDYFHRYKEDIALFGELGIKVFRMSIAWTRIYPTGEEEFPNPQGIEFYHKVFDECHKYGIEPMVTISHFDVPYALCVKYHGWYDRKLIELFEKYCKTLFEEYKNDVKYWIPFNEINVPLFNLLGNMIDDSRYELCGDAQMLQGMLYKNKEDLPKNMTLFQRKVQALHHQLVANAKVIQLGRKINSNFKFGSMTAYSLMYPMTTDPNDQLLALKSDMAGNDICMDVMVKGEYSPFALKYFESKNIKIKMEQEDTSILKKGCADFITFSYYMSGCVSQREDVLHHAEKTFSGLRNKYLKKTDWNFQTDPVGLRIALNKVYNKYGLPIFISENGLGAYDELVNGTVYDDYRIDYLRDHIQQIKLASEEDGVDVFGYAVWGFIDLVSVGTGEHKKRYGLIYVDKNDDRSGDFSRYKKQSFYWYQKVIKTNGDDLT